ncbi:murein biosynthesis integral membrane protein MurJ [Parvularcula sp. IMCC14364]|uniref:murein biosynthesis integral membrane protein MurJ n=1 Tax=Parvularcula sp. IMCC14364 TaxID=3067902 RepID=UPI002740AE97|nr:murein biosynthesis integral membrane protein MurJ [Parvularcula sp. IMCC14364]
MARGILKSMATVSGLIMLSRVFGFARQVLISGVIGASGSPVADAFWAAFRLPNMFRRLLAEGAFQAAFIPLFQGRHVESGHEEAKRFAEDVLAWLVFILTGLSAFVMIFAPLFVFLLATGFKEDPEKFDLTVAFIRIMFPYLAMMSLVGLGGGILNSLHKFAAAAAAPLALNICMIIAVLVFANEDVVVTGYAASWGVFAGGIAQLAILVFGAWRSGFLLRLRLPKVTPHVKRLLILGTPGFIGASALQVNTFIGTNIASREAGAISWLMNADQLYQLPLAMIGITLGIVLMPSMSRALKKGNEAGARDSLNRGLELALLFAVPAAAALVAMPVLICAALYTDFAGDALQLVGREESAYTLADAEATGMALMLFGFGLPAFCLHKVLASAFFARENTRTPMKFSLVAIAINTVLSISLFPSLSYLAVPVATGIASWVEVTLLARQLSRDKVLQPDLRLLARAPRIIIAALLMGLAIYFALNWEAQLVDLMLGQLWLVLIALTFIGLALYGGLCLLLGGARLQDISTAIGRAPRV